MTSEISNDFIVNPYTNKSKKDLRRMKGYSMHVY